MAMEQLGAVDAELDREAAEDAELRDKYGPRWSRPASAALSSQLREKIGGASLVSGDAYQAVSQGLLSCV